MPADLRKTRRVPAALVLFLTGPPVRTISGQIFPTEDRGAAVRGCDGGQSAATANWCADSSGVGTNSSGSCSGSSAVGPYSQSTKE